MKSLKVLVATFAVAIIPAASWGAGFALFEHGNKGLAMGGAFSAIADDGSAIFWNPAGLAGQEKSAMMGATLIMPTQEFTGSPQYPYPGDGYYAEQQDQVFYPPHFYMVVPLNDKVTVGLGFYSPFGLGTWWDDDWAGRFINKRTDLKVFNLNPTLAYQISDTWSLGVGIDYSIGQLDLTRNIGIVNPFTQGVVDVAQVHLQSDGISNTGWGYNLGVLGRFDGGWSAALTYRSEIDIDLDDADASFTQYTTGSAELDGLVDSIFPFDENIPLVSGIGLPAFATLAFAWENERWTASVQAGWQGWSSFDSLALEFPGNPLFDQVIPENWKDVYQYRAGVEFRSGHHGDFAFRGGVVIDESPQPAASMSPLFVGGDRVGYSVGFGFNLSDKIRVDVADLYLLVDDRTTDGTTHDNFEGHFESQANLFGISLGYTF